MNQDAMRSRARIILDNYLTTGVLGADPATSPLEDEERQTLISFYCHELKIARDSVEHYRHEDGHLDIGIRMVEQNGSSQFVRNRSISLDAQKNALKVDEDVLRYNGNSIDHVRVIISKRGMEAQAVHIDQLHPEKSFDQTWNAAR